MVRFVQAEVVFAGFNAC